MSGRSRIGWCGLLQVATLSRLPACSADAHRGQTYVDREFTQADQVINFSAGRPADLDLQDCARLVAAKRTCRRVARSLGVLAGGHRAEAHTTMPNGYVIALEAPIADRVYPRDFSAPALLHRERQKTGAEKMEAAEGRRSCDKCVTEVFKVFRRQAGAQQDHRNISAELSVLAASHRDRKRENKSICL
jgi:hypothetical protein